MATGWNTADNGGGLTLSNGTPPLQAAAATNNSTWESVRSTNSPAKTSGKWHAECKIITSTLDQTWMFGIADGSATLAGAHIGASAHGIGFDVGKSGTSTQIYQGGSVIFSLTIATVINDVIAIEIDIPNALIWFQNVTRGTGWTDNLGGFTGTPSAGTSGKGIAFTATVSAGIMLGFSGYNYGTSSPTGLLNTASAVGPVSSGFTIWDVAALTPLAVGTYYIDNAIGNDTWNGTAPTGSGPTGPWATPGHLSSYAISGGTTVLLNSANPAFTSGFSLTGSNRGSSPVPSAAAPVILGSYGAGNATISISAAGTSAVAVTDWGGIIIQNLTVIGPGATVGTVDGVGVQNTTASVLSFIQILNVTASGFGAIGIDVTSYPTALVIDNVLISGCVAHDNCGAAVNNTVGIRAYACTNVHITGCTVYNNAGLAGQSSWTGGGILINNSTAGTLRLTDASGNACNGIIEYCEVYNNGGNSNSSAGPVGIFVNGSGNVTVQFCESYLNHTNSSGDGDGYDFEICTSCIMQYCYSHDNDGAGFQLYAYSGANNTNCTIRYCVSQHDGTKAIAGASGIIVGNDGGTQSGLAIYNNTVYASNAAAFAFGGSAPASNSGNVSNNIFYTTGTNKLIRFAAAGNPSSMLFHGNNYYASGTFSADWSTTNYTGYNTGTGATNWRAGSGQETSIGGNIGFSVNPSLTNPGGGVTTHGYFPRLLSAYLLQSGSPMLGAGLNMSTNFSITPGNQDYFGVAIPNATAGGSGFNVGADNGPAPPQRISPRNMIFPLLLGWRSWVTLAAAWRFGKAVKDNKMMSRRRLFGKGG